MSCRPDLVRPDLPGPFRAAAEPRRVVVAKRKHGDRVDRWRWAGDLVGTAGPGWRVVRHVKGRDVRILSEAGDPEPESTITFRWLGTQAPATILVKLDEVGSLIEVKVDAALPVRLRRGRLIFVDLDVDVVRDAAGVIVVRDWDVFEERLPLLGYTDASRTVAAAGEAFGLRLLAAWEPTLGADIAAILAATATPVGAVAGR